MGGDFKTVFDQEALHIREKDKVERAAGAVLSQGHGYGIGARVSTVTVLIVDKANEVIFAKGMFLF